MTSPTHRMVAFEKSIDRAIGGLGWAMFNTARRRAPIIQRQPGRRDTVHAESLASWRHEHVFLGAQHSRNERRSWAVVVLCGTMMVAEITGGWLWGSMALIAD